MPIAFLAALASSLALHAAALFLPDVDLSPAAEAPPLTAELQPPPPPPLTRESPRPPASPPRQQHPPRGLPARPGQAVAPVTPPAAEQQPGAEPEPSAEAAPVAADATIPAAAPPPAPDPHLPAHGFVRYTVYRGSQGLEVGRAEHRWEFADGRYRLTAVTETVGLAAFFKPIRVELESRGFLTADGLRPERFTTRRNGGETRENADFDWEAGSVTLERDGRRYPLARGAQDLVSFHYQLGYLASLGDGAGMGVANGRKYEFYRFDSHGEETLDTPAGTFRTLHLRVQTDSTTDVWLALDRSLLPVKIRHADRKGDSFEQVATELGTQ